MTSMRCLALALAVAALAACGEKDKPKPADAPAPGPTQPPAPAVAPDAGGDPPQPNPGDAPPETPPQDPPADAPPAAEDPGGLLKQVTEYIRQRKPELAKAALDKLEAMKAKLSPTLRAAVEAAKKQLAELKAGGG